MGFVSNLAQTIIKEQEEDRASLRSDNTAGSQDELTDDQLALMGPPWAKEGNLTRKIYLSAEGKRSKDKNWKPIFAVLQKGEIHMFVFGSGTDVTSRGVVGGGNWLVSIPLLCHELIADENLRIRQMREVLATPTFHIHWLPQCHLQGITQLGLIASDSSFHQAN